MEPERGTNTANTSLKTKQEEISQLERATRVIKELTDRLPQVAVQDLIQFLRHPTSIAIVPTIPTFDLEQFLHVAVANAGRLVDAETTAFGIRMEGSDSFVPWIFVGSRLDLEQELRLLVRGQNFPRTADTAIHSFLGVSVYYKKDSIGDLYVANKTDGSLFTDQDRYILDLFAIHIGAILAQSFLLWLATSHARELTQLRDQFAAMVAHDLRNPIHAIILQIAVLRRLGITAIHSSLDSIERSAMRLSRMTNDLLDAARIQLSRTHLVRHMVDVPELVQAVVHAMALTLGGRAVSVTMEEDIQDVSLDTSRFEQILINLIDNGAKSSPENTPIEVRIASKGEGVEVAVQDHGVGIAEEELDRLFDRFYQSQRARESKSGLGLGLYIVRGLVEAHHGRITVESKLGEGTTFRVWFPYAPPVEEPAP